MIRPRPDYLRGYTGGTRVHAVPTLERDPRPLQHGHSPRRALCGALCAVKPNAWTARVPHACARCAAKVAQ